MRTLPAFPPALRRRLLAWSAVLLCAASCLNPQPDTFPQANGNSDNPSAQGATFTPSAPMMAAAGSEAAPRAAATADNATPAALAPPAPAPVPPSFVGEVDAGAPPPVDGGAADAEPPADGAL